MDDILTFTANGIFCPPGDFYIDPWRKVPKALITHAHSDHSRRGMGEYMAHKHSVSIMKLRLGKKIPVLGVDFGEKLFINCVAVSFHPAGHIIGSSQIRVEHKGRIAVASGDYKVEDDGISGTFEPIKCHSFISETTFGLPVYQWRPQDEVFQEINDWWSHNAENHQTTLLVGYSLGKAQRMLQHLDRSIGPVYTHDSVEDVNEAFRKQGIPLKPTTRLNSGLSKEDLERAIIIAPGSASLAPWSDKMGELVVGNASGWLATRKGIRFGDSDRGFVLSDHADWYGLNAAITATGAERVYLTHGYSELFARWLNDQGIESFVEETLFEGENPEA